MKKFSCDDCVGMCCACPPAMSSEDEILFAVSSGKRLIAMEIGDGYSVSVAKDGSACPYLNNDGKCSIYNNRFNICKTFECKALDEDRKTFLDNPGYMDAVKKLTTNRNNIEKAILFDEHMIGEYQIEVVDIDEWVQLVNGVDVSFAVSEIMRIVEKNV